MSITATQAMHALYYFRECTERASVAYYIDAETGDASFHLAELQKNLGKAAAELGFNIVPIEAAATEPVSA